MMNIGNMQTFQADAPLLNRAGKAAQKDRQLADHARQGLLMPLQFQIARTARLLDLPEQADCFAQVDLATLIPIGQVVPKGADCAPHRLLVALPRLFVQVDLAGCSAVEQPLWRLFPGEEMRGVPVCAK
ncbi:MAG TPA: hypothetical protein VF797_06990, partial [Noviherbaspirillum sp.]